MIDNNLFTQFVYGSVWADGVILYPCAEPCSNNQWRISVRDARRALRSLKASPKEVDHVMNGTRPLHSHITSSNRRGYGMLTDFRLTDDSVFLTMVKYISYDPAVEGSHRLTGEIEEIMLDRTRLTATSIRPDFLQLKVEVARHPSKEGIRVNLKRWMPAH